MLKSHLLLLGHESQLHLELLHFEFAEKFIAGRRLADKFIHGVNEAEHLTFTLNSQVKCLAIGTYQRDTPPGKPAILLKHTI